ncbi:MAG: 30S ribosomal protein S20 [Spirochaetales bacterium]|nr:30S ribosomal protein S20 [Spirochaetales bacterium]
MKDSQAKRHRQSLKRRTRNRMVKSRIKTVAKKIQEFVQENKKEESAAAIKEYEKMVDSAVSKGIFHKNSAARKKSRAARQLKKIK